MPAERPVPPRTPRRLARTAGRVAVLASLPLWLTLSPANAGATMVVDSEPGVGGEVVKFYEFSLFDKFADRLAIRQDLGPNSLTFQVTSGTPIINYTTGTPCTGFATQTVTCNFPDGIAHLEVDTGEHNDVVVSTAPVTTYWDGGPGRDELTGGPGIDVMEGGTGPVVGNLENDILRGGPGPDLIYGQGGDDILDGGAGNDLVDGGPGNDQLEGGSGADLLFGGEGNDTLSGGEGRDEFHGGPGNDTATYAGRSSPIDVTIEGLPNDGGAEDGYADNVQPDVERLIAGDGDDQLRSSAGGSTIEGRGGDDVMIGGPGSDHFHGGAGNDRITLGAGFDTADGGEGDDIIAGGSGNDLLLGGPGNDLLLGEAGDDNLIGDGGDDHLDGGVGEDTMSGGDGTDTVTYAARVSPVVVTIDDVANDGGPEDGHGDTIWSDVENVIGGAGDDTITGSDAAELIRGGPGDDTIAGGAGDDHLYGDAGNDILVGGPGSDHLFGLGGNDTLNARDNQADAHIDCGAGIDTALTDASDPPTVGCEEAPKPPQPGGTPLGKLAGKKIPVKRAKAGGKSARGKATARPRVKCPKTAPEACGGRIVLKAQKKKPGGGRKLIKLGKARYEVEAGTKQRIAVKVKKKAGKLLSRKRRTKGRASLIGEQTTTKKVTFVRKR